MERHPIQTHILTKLVAATGAQGLRYRDIKPENIENDLYNYHLQYLLKEALIYKNANLYLLSDKGKQYVEDVAPLDPAGTHYDLFRVNVLACCLKKEKGKIYILNQERKCHPFYGDIGIIGGPVKKGEMIENAASRKIKEETGLEGTFQLTGIIRKIRCDQKGCLFSDILFHICVSDNCNGTLIEANEFGRNFWCDVENAVKYEKTSKQGSKFLADYLAKLKKTDYELIPLFYHQEQKTLKGF